MTSINLPVAELKPALLGLGKILNKNATLPVLSMIKVERTNEGWIALTATDLDSFVTVRLEQPDTGAPLSLLVPYTELQSLAKTCGKQDKISVSPLPDDRIALEYPIGSQNSVKRCDSIKLEEFPEIPRIEGEPIPIPDGVRTAFQEAFECASTEETRLVLNGAYLDVSDSKCHCIVGTDGRHLYASNSFHLPVKSSVIIPTHRFLGWKEFSNDGEWRLKVQEGSPALVQLSTRRWRFITKQFEGQYPNWRQVIPKEAGKTTVEIEACESVVQTINRIPDHDPQDHKIGIAVEHGVLVLLGKASAEDSQFIHVPVPGAKVTGPDVRVHLNREFLAKALNFGLGCFSIEDALSPLKFTNGGRQMIVMPLRGESDTPTNVKTKPVESPVAGETSNGFSEQKPTNERKQPMTESTQEPQSMDRIFDEVLSGIESTRESLVEKAVHLKSLGSKVKLLMREQKSSLKEIQAIRQTLKSLQGVKL